MPNESQPWVTRKLERQMLINKRDKSYAKHNKIDPTLAFNKDNIWYI